MLCFGSSIVNERCVVNDRLLRSFFVCSYVCDALELPVNGGRFAESTPTDRPGHYVEGVMKKISIFDQYNGLFRKRYNV